MWWMAVGWRWWTGGRRDGTWRRNPIGSHQWIHPPCFFVFFPILRSATGTEGGSLYNQSHSLYAFSHDVGQEDFFFFFSFFLVCLSKTHLVSVLFFFCIIFFAAVVFVFVIFHCCVGNLVRIKQSHTNAWSSEPSLVPPWKTNPWQGCWFPSTVWTFIRLDSINSSDWTSHLWPTMIAEANREEI